MRRKIIPTVLVFIPVITFFFILSLPAAFVTAADQKTQVTLETDFGTITIELDRDKAPQTTANFIAYVQAGFYDGTIFHRVIPNFMIQGGGFTADMQQKQTRAPVPNEADNGLVNRRGTIAMARTADPHSATAQFFINLKDNDFLNHRGKDRQGWGYCVFGRVVQGMDVVDAIAGQPTHNAGMHQNVPQKSIVIKKAMLLQPGAGAAAR